MSYRIWFRWADASFMTTATISDEVVANSVAHQITERLPGAVSGVDRIESAAVFRGTARPDGQRNEEE